jgi:hypothetical protein
VHQKDVKESIMCAVSEVAEVAGVSENTIKQFYRAILPRASELFPPDFKYDVPISEFAP